MHFFGHFDATSLVALPTFASWSSGCLHADLIYACHRFRAYGIECR
jgi:hypothetical protein